MLEHIRAAVSGGARAIELDFSKLSSAFPEGGLPLVAVVSAQREQGVDFRVSLPREKALADLFVNTSWAHFLSPRQFRVSRAVYTHHLPVFHFRDHREQDEAVSRLLDVIFRTVVMSKARQDALEWSIAEITENVLTHAASSVGGFVQATAWADAVQFTVSDAGIGVFAALRDTLPPDTHEADAIFWACEAGITGRPKTNAGNGLAGSRILARDSGGWFALTSGAANYVVDPAAGHDELLEELDPREAMPGTTVTVRLGNRSSFSASDSIRQLGTAGYEFYSRLDALFDADADGRYRIAVKTTCLSTISRRAGRELRSVVRNALVRAGRDTVIVDLDGVDAPSSSFVDEAFGVLASEMGEEAFSRRIRIRGATAFTASAIEASVSRRLGGR